MWRRHTAVRSDDGQPYMYQQTPQTMVEYNLLGVPFPVFSSPAGPHQDEFKGSQQHQRSQRFIKIPQYPGMGQGTLGVVEVDGGERPVEAPTTEQ